MSYESTANDGEDTLEDAERPLRERIAENPRPALLWAGGLLILLTLELGRWLDGLVSIGSAIRLVLGAVASIPGWVGSNVASQLGQIAGAVVADVVALLLLFVISSVLVWFVLPFRITDSFSLPLRVVERVGIRQTRRVKSLVERLTLTIFLAIGAALFAFTPVGTIIQTEFTAIGRIVEMIASAAPTLTSPETIPNLGHQSPDGGWEGTFLGLSPAWAWAIRTAVVLVYAFGLFAWLWKGVDVYRDTYREADWTPRDDFIRRFRNHAWGMLGLVIVLLFIIMAVWAPAISPAPIEYNIYEPFNSDGEFSYLTEDGEVEEITHGAANLNTRSDGQNTVSPLSYDQYDRFAPLGTTPRGGDLLTFLAFGARTSLIVGLTAIGVGAAVAVALSLITAYYKGIADVLTVITTDTIIAIPAFLLVMLISVIFSEGDHPIAEPMDGAVLLALVLAFAFWPGMWRAIRGPSLQVAEQEWVDAAKSYGQTPTAIMRKHMAPYIAGYIMIYASLLLGSVIIVTAALSFLGLGISSPTPEWGRIISDGRPYVDGSSWHVATISGLMIVAVVTAFNALGDGIRDAIDPEADTGDDDAATAGGGV